MAQRDKVKELVGRGLHSYHTKALQQIDRIEKKNKEQNHKISILSNELDNDYLTKTEEGSVISLEHSKEGMVYLDELQGNTLVNYCSDGSKEMTLNGDIDVEGTFVTTTEGVDNGKVDVMCEGNTLVNILKYNDSRWGANVYSNNTNLYNNIYKRCTQNTINTSLIKPNTKYTIIINKLPKYANGKYIMTSSFCGVSQTYNGFLTNNKFFVITTPDFVNNGEISFTPHLDLDKTVADNKELPSNDTMFYMFEGDWTEKEIPNEFFEGMKSVGQDDVNGHKIEILSKNGNFIELDNMVSGSFSSDGMSHWEASSEIKTEYFIKVPEGCNRVYFDRIIGVNNRIWEYDENKNSLGESKPTEDADNPIYLSSNTKYIRCRFLTGDTSTKIILFFDEKIEPKQNKKEISLNAPLRKINVNYMDKVVKISNKFYKEKSCEEILSTDYTWSTSASNTFETCKVYAVDIPNLKAFDSIGIVCDKLPVYNAGTLLSNNPQIAVALRRGANTGLLIRLPIDTDITTYINKNPFKVVVPLAKPQYEEVSSFELSTYNDVTHISNNSIIPCNMKIKNTGYNAIIKPSTLYTVALDTNKSGTIGMNLGGAKGTTTNNVLKLTTPATLTDDSLRLYGKGIKGSKVRLLEGDKTNWIPSHFEGMQSSFEDKLQDDGTYKMEILSKLGGLNLMTNSDNLTGNIPDGMVLEKVKDKEYENVCKFSGNLLGNYFAIEQPLTTKLTPNTLITISCLARTDKPNSNSKLSFYLGDNQKEGYIQFDKPLTEEYTWVKQTRRFISSSYRPHLGLSSFHGHNVYIAKMKIEYGETSTEWCPSIKDDKWSTWEFHNKIQFSSIEPLRGLDNNVKDRFIFVDGKLKIKRECGKIVFNGIENWAIYPRSSTVTFNNTIAFQSGFLIGNTHNMDNINLRNNLVPNQGVYTRDIEGIFEKNSFRISVNKNRLKTLDVNGWKEFLSNNNLTIIYPLAEPTYEEVPFELQKIILEGYENGTLFFDTNIPPTSTVTYSGETPIVKSVKLNKTEVLNNTNDINDNIIPYLMDMDYRVVCLQLATEEIEGGVSMARLFGGTYEMIKRDILSKRLTREEYGYRLADYFNAGKLTEEQVRELEELR